MKVDKELKDAINSAVKSRIDWRNNGLCYTYETTRSEKELLWANDVTVGNAKGSYGDWQIKIGGKLVATGHQRFGRNGRELLPKLSWR